MTNLQNYLPGLSQMEIAKHNTLMNAKGFFKYDELEKDVQALALEKYADINVDYEWQEFTIDFLTEKLAKMGFCGASIDFDLYRNIAHFSCDNIYLDEVIDTLLQCEENKEHANILYRLFRVEQFDSINISSTVSSYGFDMQLRYGIVGDNRREYALSQDEADILEWKIDSLVGDINFYILKVLRQEFEYLTSDTAIAETLVANEYCFNELGEIEN